MGENTIIVGSQWGDEGKGKIVDLLSKDMDVICRAQGGNNAGHTVVVGDEQTILHLIPSGILHKGKICVIGSGLVVDPKVILQEIDTLIGKGVEITSKNLIISDRCQMIMPYHVALDKAKEAMEGKGKIGTTCRGIGPCYMDKAARSGIRMFDFVDEGRFKEKLKNNLEEKNFLLKNLYNTNELDSDEIFDEYSVYARRLKPHMQNTSVLVNDYIEAGKNILYEGAQGIMLDIDHGTYPFVTSSNSCAGGICTGLGIGPKVIKKVIGILKAYTTRVGSGPFVTELKDKLGDNIREAGGEYGSTTGRPRRCGWFDAVVARYGARINGLTSWAITKLDVLDELETIKVCVAYKCNGKEITEFPNPELLDDCEPVYIDMPGWKTKISEIKKYDNLPDNAKAYLKKIEELTNTPVSIISVGPKRNQTIVL